MPDKIIDILKPPIANLRTLQSDEEKLEIVRSVKTPEGYEEQRVTITRTRLRYSNF